MGYRNGRTGQKTTVLSSCKKSLNAMHYLDNF